MSRHNPPLPVVLTNVLRVVVQSTFRGQLFENSFDYISSVGVTFTPTLLDTFITDFIAANQTAYLACLCADQTVTKYFCQDLNPATTPTQFQSVSQVGTVAGHSLPSFVSAVIQKGTNVKGQSGRGRTYLGAVPITFSTPATSPDAANAAAFVAYTALATALRAPIVSGGATWTWSITTRPIAPAYLVTNGSKILTNDTDALFGTTRRRIEGRGR